MNKSKTLNENCNMQHSDIADLRPSNNTVAFGFSTDRVAVGHFGFIFLSPKAYKKG